MPDEYINATDDAEAEEEAMMKPTLHTAVESLGVVYKPGDEQKLINQGMTEKQYEYLTKQGAISNFEGRGVHHAKAKATPAGAHGKPVDGSDDDTDESADASKTKSRKK